MLPMIKTCPKCFGTGKVDDATCDQCGGLGFVPNEENPQVQQLLKLLDWWFRAEGPIREIERLQREVDNLKRMWFTSSDRPASDELITLTADDVPEYPHGLEASHDQSDRSDC